MGETIRTASLHRQTGETDIELTLNLDGTGKTDIDTGIGFFDHMLNNFARHGLFDLTVKAKGDLYVELPSSGGRYRNCAGTGNQRGCRG